MPDLQAAIAKLVSLQEGDIGVGDAISCGARAIPNLRSLLFSRAPSGLYQPRRRAVEALAAIGANDVLIDFLANPQEISDPVERTGEEAVINAAARALIGLDDARVLPLLMSLAERQALAGVIEALGTYRRAETLPVLIAALFEDFSRGAAETAIRGLGVAARPALLHAAQEPLPSAEQEGESSLRRRRSVLMLLTEIGIPTSPPWEPMRTLIGEKDPQLALAACRLCLTYGPELLGPQAVRRLIDLLPGDWMLAQQIENCLIRHFASAHAIIEEIQEGVSDKLDPRRQNAIIALSRVRARASATDVRSSSQTTGPSSNLVQAQS